MTNDINKINPFNSVFQEFIYVRTYSRWIESEKRREMWPETVKRYCDYMKNKYNDNISTREYNEIYNAILNMEVMPSMRSLWTAGAALDNDNIAGYNCSAVVIDDIKAFAEIMYISMNGAGTGFSVEREYVYKLPVIKNIDLSVDLEIIAFEDSKLGWAEGFYKVLQNLWEGVPFECDYSKIRKKGERLKIFGGRSSGPAPLKSLIDFVTKIISNRRGEQLTTLECHDICCKIAEIVVSGGVRRSALISLSNLGDNEMRNAKMGEFWKTNPQRQYANNSVCYTRKPDLLSFIKEWTGLYRSKSGERGIFNKKASQDKANENHRRDGSQICMVNPCGEVLLRDASFCNLSEVIIRPEDDFTSLKRKIKIATIIGTWQAGLTDFKFLRKKWKKNCDEERLLGVSLTGLRDHKILGNINDTAKKWLGDLKHIAISQNKKISKKLNINQSAAITLIKPSGTVSLLTDTSAGAHKRNTKTGYYIRRVRISATDPLCLLLRDQGVTLIPEVGQTPDNASTFVIEFPVKAPKGSTLRDKETAKEQLEYWKMLRDFFCEHNPSITINIKDEEWLETADWVYKNFDEIGGLAFLPSSDHIYQLAPYEDITKEKYDELIKEFPKIDFSRLSEYEIDDNTEGAKEFACIGDKCSIV